MAKSKGKAARLAERRHKGSAREEDSGLSFGWPKVLSGLRRPSQNQGWSRGYDGPNKGTW